MVAADAAPEALGIGRYVIFEEIAQGGMATVHMGRLRGSGGFARTVAVKRLHPHLARDPQFVAMFMDEAHLAARIAHRNVVPVLDVVSAQGELFLVMDYVHGVSLAALLPPNTEVARVPASIAVAVMIDVLHGLHAAHEARGDQGIALGIVHRDVSPPNILVGADGVARVVDFGIAIATKRSAATTREGTFKGKLSYMAPEQLTDARVDRRTDVYAASVVLWEMLAGRRLFERTNAAAELNAILSDRVEPPSALAGTPDTLDAVVMRGLSRNPGNRYATAEDMAAALEEVQVPATAREVAEWVTDLAGGTLEQRAVMREAMESRALPPPPSDSAPPLRASVPRLEARVADDGPTEVRSIDFAPPEAPRTNGGLFRSSPIELEPALPLANRRPIAIVVAAASALVVFAVVARACVRTHTPPVAHATTPTAPSGVAAVIDAPPAADGGFNGIAIAPPTAAPTSVRPVAAPIASSARPHPATIPPPTRATRGRNCSPPYTVDEDGVLVPKRECLR